MRTKWVTLAALPLVLSGCARIEHASDIGSENEQIPFYVYRHHVDARLVPEQGYEVAPGTNHVIIGFWLRPGGQTHHQFREELRIEFEGGTGRIVTGVWDSNYYNVGQDRQFEGDEDSNHIEGGSIVFPQDDGGTGWMSLSLDHEWWRTTPVVEIKYRKYTNPSRFPTE